MDELDHKLEERNIQYARFYAEISIPIYSIALINLVKNAIIINIIIRLCMISFYECNLLSPTFELRGGRSSYPFLRWQNSHPHWWRLWRLATSLLKIRDKIHPCPISYFWRTILYNETLSNVSFTKRGNRRLWKSFFRIGSWGLRAWKSYLPGHSHGNERNLCRRGSSYVDVDFPRQVYFLVAYGSARWLSFSWWQSKEISNRKTLLILSLFIGTRLLFK